MTEARYTYDYATTFQQYIDTWLDERGYTVKEFAHAHGLSDSGVYRWRRGEYPSWDNAAKLADALNLPLKRLYVLVGLLTPEQADENVTAPDPSKMSNEDLLRELERRLGQSSE
ncbi:Helix-turn-helix [Actinopolyspora xinjiangensis]|uniref:Helix-turn-helix n=1 Tax=Actinopolyspora xinjiangensis TaxID=405564 RepID=A0A1H0U5C7_9ACTN|nr:helix-turn-helix transcriptional regulator [Actinopolyspora xinjiangensis]SDP61384.1 Helix-turn-helix [Actinopolyspora xinjiangensis]